MPEAPERSESAPPAPTVERFVAEWAEGDGWLVMTPDGSVVARPDVPAVLAHLAHWVQRHNVTGFHVSLVTWTNVPADAAEEIRSAGGTVQARTDRGRRPPK